MGSNKRILIKRIKQNERENKMKEKYFSVVRLGDIIRFDEYYHKPKMGIHAILAKDTGYQDGHYFVLQDKNYKMYLSKIVIQNNRVRLKKISKSSAEYEQNSVFLDYLLLDAKEYRKSELQEFFEKEYKKYDVIAIRSYSYNDDGVQFGKFIAKHKYRGNYYFVMKNESGEFVVAKAVWFGFAKLVHIDEKEYERKAELFESWIKEAKKKPIKKKQ